uniref:Uncharacterized protein n=1 Tax=Pararge aegeria TaxID=116150 RepID=S4NYU5_9NEOP
MLLSLIQFATMWYHNFMIQKDVRLRLQAFTIKNIIDHDIAHYHVRIKYQCPHYVYKYYNSPRSTFHRIKSLT